MLRVSSMGIPALASVLEPYGLRVELLEPGEPIDGSFWGESEAGLVGNRLLVRPDTPVHSAFHEACHYICMTRERRSALHTDAGGDDAEETAVCYLQVLLAASVGGITAAGMFHDMDEWGYSFRLGSAERWFAEDAGDARQWLVRHGILAEAGHLTGRLRES